MNTHTFRLNSVVPHGVGGPNAAALDLIYSILLDEYGQDSYSYIFINQIDDELNELVMKEAGKKIFVNIRIPAYDDFEQKPVAEQNLIRLDVAHKGLLRIAEYDKKLDVEKLELIKKKIIASDFSFDFTLKAYPRKGLVAKIIVHPNPDSFDYYIQIEKDEVIKCRTLIYKGLPDLIYYPGLFSTGKWKSESEFVLSGKRKEVDIHLYIDQCRIEIINLSNYESPPYFTMMRTDISKGEGEKSTEDWLHSLPPHIAAVIREANN